MYAKSKKILALLTAVNYFNYIDRFILAAVLASIKTDMGLSDFQAGLLATAFMVPYMFTAPLFGWFGDLFNRPRILALGTALWSISSFLTGQAGSFISLSLSRCLLGVGESAFTVTSVPFISDLFKEKKGRALSFFSSATPVGAALGFILGGLLAHWYGWRVAFYIVGFPGLIMALLLWNLPDPRPKLGDGEKLDLRKNLQVLLHSQRYILAVLGYCAYSFVVGGVAHWTPSFIQRNFSLDQATANLFFGGIAVGAGLIGTLVGGYLVDLLQPRHQHAHLQVSGYSMLLALPFYALGVISTNIIMFAGFVGLAQFFFFISTSPINIALIELAPAKIKTSAVAIAVFFCHVLGDAISPPLIGFLSDHTGSLKTGMLACSFVVFLCGGLWLMASKKNLSLRKKA